MRLKEEVNVRSGIAQLVDCRTEKPSIILTYGSDTVQTLPVFALPLCNHTHQHLDAR